MHTTLPLIRQGSNYVLSARHRRAPPAHPRREVGRRQSRLAGSSSGWMAEEFTEWRKLVQRQRTEERMRSSRGWSRGTGELGGGPKNRFLGVGFSFSPQPDTSNSGKVKETGKRFKGPSVGPGMHSRLLSLIIKQIFYVFSAHLIGDCGYYVTHLPTGGRSMWLVCRVIIFSATHEALFKRRSRSSLQNLTVESAFSLKPDISFFH